MQYWRNTSENWGMISIVIHWLTALVVVALFLLGLWMVDLDYYDQWYKSAPFIHKSIGIVLLFVTTFRVCWRIFFPIPVSLPTHTKPERILAHLMHILLYLLLFSIMVSGYLISTADGREVSVFGWFEIPAIVTSIPHQEDIAGEVHFYLACTVIACAILHGLAAVKHHVVDKDRTLKRMLGMR